MNARIRKSRVLIILLVLLKMLLPLFLSVSLCFASALRALHRFCIEFVSEAALRRFLGDSWAFLGPVRCAFLVGGSAL